jgi:5-methylthioribose kinase
MDVGFFFSHLLLKAVRSPRWREPMFAVVRAALTSYGHSAITRRGLGHLGVCLLARVDGTSPVDYLPLESQKDAVRRLGRKILLDSPSDWETALTWADEEVRNQGP